MARLESLMRTNFVEYASYSILDRAIPDLRDGLKPVQRRILHTLFSMHDGRYHKVANAIGETMKLHPHGDASIGDALIVLANKGFFIDRQGNFGNLHTGHPAAAPRYIECRLTPLALETLFNEPLTEFIDSYDGRSREPIFLPAKLPVILMLGTEGIAVGMSTRILPHNLTELWQAQIAILEGEPFDLLPDFPQGGLVDVTDYDDGRGKVEVRAHIEVRDAKHVVIREIPYGTTTESLIASIESAVQKNRVKVASIDDYTTDRVEIELSLSRGVTADEVVPQLFAYTDCKVSLSSNIVVIDNRRPVELSAGEALRATTEQLLEQLRSELEWERQQLLDREHWITLEQIFVEKRVYKRIEEATTAEAVRDEVVSGMHEHETLFKRPMVDDDVKRLLDLRIRRISAYDIGKNRSEIDEIGRSLEDVAHKLEHLTQTTIDYIRSLLDQYGENFPRRTRVDRFEEIDKKAVARQTTKLSYDRESGFFGSAVKGNRFELTVSEFDLILAVSSDGSYRVMTPPEKVLLPERVLYCEVFDPDQGVEFIVVYRDKKKIAYGKRVRIEKFIRNRDYQLIKSDSGRVDLLLAPDQAGVVNMEFAPAPRQRVKKGKFDLAQLEPVGVTARGSRLAPKPVARIKHSIPKKRPTRKKTPKSKVARSTRASETEDPPVPDPDDPQTRLF
ncbi:DNA topoisomerase IV subunit A [Myxococcota bacterium]|nr:DNA topoisomerase IV subunit A [Myxococcota bacterium]